jgi:hypothetical protein
MWKSDDKCGRVMTDVKDVMTNVKDVMTNVEHVMTNVEDVMCVTAVGQMWKM